MPGCSGQYLFEEAFEEGPLGDGQAGIQQPEPGHICLSLQGCSEPQLATVVSDQGLSRSQEAAGPAVF